MNVRFPQVPVAAAPAGAESTGEGVVADEQALAKFEVTPVDSSASTGTHENELPLKPGGRRLRRVTGAT